MDSDYSGIEKRGIPVAGYAMALTLISIGAVLAWAGFTYDPKAEAEQRYQEEQDQYEEAYRQCMSRETIEADYCHEIALCTVWGCNGE
jgi:exopolysaccharide biosynthesis predicted pyruvyltransferase EpsI